MTNFSQIFHFPKMFLKTSYAWLELEKWFLSPTHQNVMYSQETDAVQYLIIGIQIHTYYALYIGKNNFQIFICEAVVTYVFLNNTLQSISIKVFFFRQHNFISGIYSLKWYNPWSCLWQYLGGELCKQLVFLFTRKKIVYTKKKWNLFIV